MMTEADIGDSNFITDSAFWNCYEVGGAYIVICGPAISFSYTWFVIILDNG